MKLRSAIALARAVIALALVAACGGGTTTTTVPTPATTPAPSPTPTLMDRCPDASDGPSLIAMTLEDTHRALVTNPSAKVPPACVLVAFAQIRTPVPDSLDAHALVVASAMERRGTDQRDLLAGEVLLFARRARYAELGRAYDRLVVVDSQPSIEVSRLAAAAARMRGDSSALIAIVARATTRTDAPASMRNELLVLRQIAPLLAAINQARGLIRQNPRYVAGYPSIVANFGTLAWADSVAVYVRRGLAQGAAAASLSPSLESLVNAMLRHASLYASTYEWDAAITRATRVDSALSSPSTKYLIASLTVQASNSRIASASALINGTTWWPPARAAATAAPTTRADGCGRLAALDASLATADAAMAAGGNKYPSGVAELGSALTSARASIARLREACGA